MSIAGSYAESIYFEAAYQVPGPCKTCCLRCPVPSLLATGYFVAGVVGFCITGINAFFLTEAVFPEDLDISFTLSTWRFFMMISLIIWGSLNLILAVVMISCSCLGTGATRKEFVCRFRSRAKGRCQTWVLMLFIFFLLLIWIGLALFMILPLEFFSIQNRGQCQSCTVSGSDTVTDCKGEIDLRQWALAPWDREEESKVLIINEDLATFCSSSVLWWFCSAFALNLLVIISLVHYLINFSANFAKLRDRFKAGYIDRRTGTYLTRSDNLRGSRASINSRASMRSRQARSKRNGATARNVNGTSTISTIQTAESYKNDGLHESPDEISLHDVNTYNRTRHPEDEPPSYSAQPNYDYQDEYFKDNQDEYDYGRGRNYRRGDEPADEYYGDDRMWGGSKPEENYKLQLGGFDDEREDEGRYQNQDRMSTFGGATYHQGDRQEPDNYNSDPSSLQSQVSQFRARQEYFI
ncbi:uncharacterized protein [Apostichopus japonicus]|uniref:uncharacterized protein isoform X1 n=1 Tax=Stichopus japonicus TaxID=307972 RepID=UPI003AB63D45